MESEILSSKQELTASSSTANSLSNSSLQTLASPANLKYFGYLHTETGHQYEVAAHTNLSVIDWTNYSSYSQLYMDLSAARYNGNKAVVTTPVLFMPASNGVQPYTLRSDAQTQWNTFINRLIGDGFFNASNPESGTVVGFYPVDEPELGGGMGDVNGAPSPKLVQILNIIRSNYYSRLAPLATCTSYYYGKIIEGLKLFDWIGLDVYSRPIFDKDDKEKIIGYENEDDNAYVGKFYHLQSLLQLRPEQRMILVPQACNFNTPDHNGWTDHISNDPNRMLFVAQTNPAVMAIIPFIWNSVASENIDGLRSGLPPLPAIRQQYDQIGKQVKFAGANASWVGQRIPGSMIAGRPCDIRIDMRNTGNVVWEPGVVHLGTQNPHDNTIWGSHRVWIPSRIKPGEIAEIVFTVMVPSTPGYYNMQGRMVAEGITWFGDWTPNVLVNVVAG